MKRLLVSTVLALSMLMPVAAQAWPVRMPLPAPPAAPPARQISASAMQWQKISQVSAGYYHTCALLVGGGVKCWGSDAYGQLGNGTTTPDPMSVPVEVTGLTSGVVALAAGYYHSCALLASGGVKCWGANTSGQLGDGTTNQHSTPVDVSGLTGAVTDLAAGAYHTCALLAGGGVKCWGANAAGQLGNGTISNYSSTPVDVSGLTTGATALTLGALHTCAALAAGGVKCWGDNRKGQLGNGTTTDDPTPVPVNVSDLTGEVTDLAAGMAHTCAARAAGGVKCWGANGDGQLGDGTTSEYSSTPVDVSGLTSGAATPAAGGQHSCAALAAGGAKCWGYNQSGQLGDGTTMNSPTPVDVSGLTSEAAAMAVGGRHTCALIFAAEDGNGPSESGGVKCWGNNDHGQLGDGTTTQRTKPVNVRGLGVPVNAYLPLVVR